MEKTWSISTINGTIGPFFRRGGGAESRKGLPEWTGQECESEGAECLISHKELYSRSNELFCSTVQSAHKYPSIG